MKIATFFSVLATVFLIVLISFSNFGCRLEEEPLDKNREPETFLTFAPPETLDSNYRVHMYWHGEDKDGTVEKYIFYISDSVRTLTPEKDRNAEMLDWNPAKRKDDYLKGHFTTKTDSVILFKGYDSKNKVTRNRQAFHVVAVDDGGLIDETPARVQFFATVPEVPKVKYWVKIGNKPYKAYNNSILDTISLFIPIRFKFQGITNVVADAITGYTWALGGQSYPLDKDQYIPEPGEIVEFPNENNRYYFTKIINKKEEPDSSVFLNTPENPLSDGDFYFRTVVRDQAGAESEADPITGKGLFHLVINHDPDTKVEYGDCYYINSEGVRDTLRPDPNDPENIRINFADDKPDTLPFGSILRLHYRGWDDQSDILEYKGDDAIPIRFKYRLKWTNYSNLENNPSNSATSYLPMISRAEDTDPGGDMDSVTMSVGPSEYHFMVRSYDEQYRYDHTPAEITFYGNYQPTVENFELGVTRFDFTTLDTVFYALGDTIKLADPTNPDNWGVYPFNVIGNGNEVLPCKTGEDPDALFYPISIKFTGHDDSRDPPGSAIKQWYYWVDSNYSFIGENKMLSSNEVNVLLKNIKIDVPISGGAVDLTRLDQLPSGLFNIHIIGFDIGADERYEQKIRMTPQGDIFSSSSDISNYARKDTLSGQFYIDKLW